MIQDYLEKIRKKHNVTCLKAVIYARYSSDMQRSESIDAQKRYINTFATNNNIIIVGEYIDEAQSAKRDNRIEFQHMLSDAKAQNDWQLVLVHKLDRFARNRFDSAAYRVELRKNKKFLISTTEQFDDSPESTMMEAIIEAMAEFYSKNLAREVMKGMTENALKGLSCGGTPPLGYEIKNLVYIINEFEAQAVKLIFTMFLNGYGYGEIIQSLNRAGYRTKKNASFTKNSLHDILRNEKYTGTFVYNKRETADPFSGKRNTHSQKSEDEIIRVENAIPSIISKEDFQKVQEIMHSRKRTYTNNAKEVYLLSGKIRCGICGASYVGTRKIRRDNKKYIYYLCNVKQRSKNLRCNNRFVVRDKLENFVVQAINQYISQFSDDKIDTMYQMYQDSIKSDNNTEIDALKKEVSNIDRELNRIADVITITSSPTLIEKLTTLEQQKHDIQTRIKMLSYSQEPVLSKVAIKNLLDRAQQMLKEKSVPNLKELIDLIVKEIIVNEDEIIVYLNFSNNIALEQKVHMTV